MITLYDALESVAAAITAGLIYTVAAAISIVYLSLETCKLLWNLFAIATTWFLMFGCVVGAIGLFIIIALGLGLALALTCISVNVRVGRPRKISRAKRIAVR